MGASTPAIEARLKNLLDETRLAMLETQLLLGCNTMLHLLSASGASPMHSAGSMVSRCFSSSRRPLFCSPRPPITKMRREATRLAAC